MVHINIWFIARSRSTVLTKSLSQIPDSKVFFETFLWASYLGDENSVLVENSDLVPEVAKENMVIGFNYKSVLKQIKMCDAKVTILKDFLYGFKGRYGEVIDKDSVNVFLYRHPKYVFSSYLKECQKYVHEKLKEYDSDLTLAYRCMLECIEYVDKHCSKDPVIVDGSMLSSKEGARRVVQKVCETAGIEFSESFLSWPATEGGFSSNGVVPRANQTLSLETGFFTKANNSTGFEDSKEREVNLQELAKTHPTMVQDIELCQPFYDEIASLPYNI